MDIATKDHSVNFRLLSKFTPVKVYSFDLFDTLLARQVAEPADVFRELERRFSAQDKRWEGVADKRIQAELEARRVHRFAREVTLDEIYEEMNRRFHISPEDCARLKRLELEIEREYLYPVPENRELVQQLRGKGKRVIYISDIYLPTDFIHEILNKFDLLPSRKGLYLSSVYRVMKAREARLYDRVLENEKIPAARIRHTGDNMVSDVDNAIARGLRGVHFRGNQFNRYEKLWLGGKVPSLEYSKQAGLMRYLRGRCPYGDEHRKAIWETSVNVSGPVIISFVYWCLNTARERGLTRLYFLARDGQILWKVARIIARGQKDLPELRYLRVSRQAVLLPALTELNQEGIGWLLAPTTLLTPRIILRRAGLSPEELSAELAGHGFHKKDFDRHFPRGDRERLVNFLKDPAVTKKILGRAREERGLATGYLRQEGLTADGRFALVDIGWHGSLQRSISRLLEMEGFREPVTGFYFGVRGRKLNKENDVMLGWFSDYRNPDVIDKLTYIVPMLELFMAADHGGVRTYRRNGDVFEPVLKHPENYTGLKWGVGVQQEAVLRLAEYAHDRALPFSVRKDILSAVLKLFLLSPTGTEARVYGKYLDAEDQNESYHLPLAKPFSVLEYAFFKMKGRLHHHNEWKAGALALTPGWIKKLGRVYSRARRVFAGRAG